MFCPRPGYLLLPARFLAGRALLASAVLLLSGAASAAQVPTQGATKVAQDIAFSTPAHDHIASAETLKAFLAKLRQNRHENRFCFVQERFAPEAAQPAESDTIWMVWITGARIYTFTNRPGGPREDPASEAAGLVNSNPVNLKTDVVATQDEVGTSTFLVTRAWADRIVDQCQRVGVTVRIPSSARTVR